MSSRFQVLDSRSTRKWFNAPYENDLGSPIKVCGYRAHATDDNCCLALTT
jgi:hypothetical protein